MDNTCVCCGTVIPEGRLVCPQCERPQKLLIDAKALVDRIYTSPVYITGMRNGKTLVREALEKYRDSLVRTICTEPPVVVVEVDVAAQMLCNAFGDTCPCNYNGNDEWLPLVCDDGNTCGEHDDPLYCWKQYIKHYGERKSDGVCKKG